MQENNSKYNLIKYQTKISYARRYTQRSLLYREAFHTIADTVLMLPLLFMASAKIPSNPVVVGVSHELLHRFRGKTKLSLPLRMLSLTLKNEIKNVLEMRNCVSFSSFFSHFIKHFIDDDAT